MVEPPSPKEAFQPLNRTIQQTELSETAPFNAVLNRLLPDCRDPTDSCESHAMASESSVRQTVDSDYDQQSEDAKVSLALEISRDEELPLQLHHVELSESGEIRRRRKGADLTFSFVHRGMPFACECKTTDDPVLKIVGELGKLPFTAESAKARRFLKHLAIATGGLSKGHFAIIDDQDVRLLAEVVPPQGLTPVSIIAALSAVLLEFKPFFDLAEEALAPGKTASR
ncbi:hypothetical protein ACFOW6_06420 [Fodinicurvata halophila]|uniref:YbjN domain-containing protein n=1 Tax=Fodinicurvata halophila TaxID=1419723 RepID=A0ABV8UK84_9PROT